MCIIGIVIVGLIDMGVNMSTITPESWHPSWPLQKANVQLLEIGAISQVKQIKRWVACIGPEDREES